MTANDPTGLHPALMYLAGMGGSLGISGLGLGAAALTTDAVQSVHKGKVDMPASKAVIDIAPKLAGIVTGSAAAAPVPGAVIPGIRAATTLSGAYTAMGRNLGAVMESQTGVGMALRRLKDVAEFMEPFVVPGTPSVQSVPTAFGGILKLFKDFSEKK